MKEIQLSQGKVAIVDDEDFEYLSQWKWCAIKDRNTYYAVRAERKNGRYKRILIHRQIMDAPKGKEVDHKDGNGLDNQKSNLRLCTHKQNTRNSISIKGTSIYKGVFWCKDRLKWRAGIKNNYKTINLGYYESEVNAAFAYDKAAIKYFGEYARLNFA